MDRRVPAATLMRCTTCKNGTTKPGLTTYVADRDGHVAVIRGVPADICEQCGETYFDEKTAQSLYEQAERILAHGSEVEITRFAA
jgi:YgiT-type zinc finger domain-containing protein